MSVCHIFPTTTTTSTPKLLLIISLLKHSLYIFNNSKILLEIKNEQKKIWRILILKN